MVKRRVSVKNIDGSVGWQMCEGTTLTCPAVYQGPDTGSCNDLSDSEAGTPNKRARICSENWDNESGSEYNYDVKN